MMKDDEEGCQCQEREALQVEQAPQDWCLRGGLRMEILKASVL